MILLEFANRILEELIASKLENPSKRENVDVVCADFDGVQFHVSNQPDTKNLINISLQWKCADELLKLGGTKILKDVYGDLLQATPEAGYHVTLRLDLDKPPTDPALPGKIALLKRHLFSAPFLSVFDNASASNIITIQYRDDEALYIKREGDRALVIFSVAFRDADDVVIGKVFLQEFADARKTMTNVPSVTFSQKDPPGELSSIKNVKTGANQGFVTFVLFPNHIANREKTVNLIQTFRNYLHYHIKCSKGYLHTRMRNRVESLLQILNRARPEPATTVARTVTGKVFVRK